MLYLIHTFNPQWDEYDLPEWKWPKRRIFDAMEKLLEGPLSMGVGGLRRTGKTTLLKQLMGRLMEKGTLPKRICYFQFDRDLVVKNPDVVEQVLDVYLKDILDETIGRIKEKTFIFLDEIQLIPLWADVLKRYMDRDPAITFMISGSSSPLLESESTESLAGRLDMLRLPPPDFRDHMIINGLEPPPEFTIYPGLKKIPSELLMYHGANRHRLTSFYLDYLRWGGFPQLKDVKDDAAKQRYIDEVVVKKILRYDLPARLKGVNPIDLERLYEIFAVEYAQMMEYNTIARDIGISTARIKTLSRALETGYLVHFCFNHTRSKRKAGRTGKKAYLSTPTLAAYRYGPLGRLPEILGRIVENDVFLRLKEKDANLSFWRVGRQEIDFIFHAGGVALPVECKTGRLRSKSFRLIRSTAEKWKAPFGVIATLDTLDFSDPSTLHAPAYLL